MHEWSCTCHFQKHLSSVRICKHSYGHSKPQEWQFYTLYLDWHVHGFIPMHRRSACLAERPSTEQPGVVCRYQSVDEQRADWKDGHKQECKSLQVVRPSYHELDVRVVARILWKRSAHPLLILRAWLSPEITIPAVILDTCHCNPHLLPKRLTQFML